jgi:hypothetical protein
MHDVTDQTTFRHHFVILLQALKHFLMTLCQLALRPQQQEIEYREKAQHDDHAARQRIRIGRPCGLKRENQGCVH